MQKNNKQRHIAKCLLGGAVCWSAVAVSAALLLGSAFSAAPSVSDPADALPLSGAICDTPSLPLYADDGTAGLPECTPTLPKPEDAASPSEGLTDKQMLAWQEEQKKQEQAQTPQTPVTPDEPAEPEQPSEPEASDEPSESLSGERALGSEDGFVYYRQDWSEYKDVPYGNKTLGGYGCGPTNMAMIISSLTGERVSPVTLARYAEQNGMFVNGAGTAYAFITSVADRYGLKVTTCARSDSATLTSALRDGKLALTVMGPGIFSRGGHFLTLRGAADGGILIADSISYERSTKLWSAETLASQMKIDYYWIFELK